MLVHYYKRDPVPFEKTRDDLLALGFSSSCQMGVTLRDLLHLKIDGAIDGREAELEAARRML